MSRQHPVDVSISRRGVLLAAGLAGGTGLGVFASESGAVAVAAGGPRHLSASELTLLTAVVDRVVPGPPEDVAVGAVQVGCPAAIDALLAAFATDPPRIFAGAPWSDRGGSSVNHFAEFLPLDAYEEQAWRQRIEGAGGFQDVYSRGLAALAKSQPLFAQLPGAVRDVVLRTTQDADVQAMRDLAVTHTLELYLAAPEYGGNAGLGGWEAVGFEGDTQPRGFTPEEVDHPAYAPLPLLSATQLDTLLSGLAGSLLGSLTPQVSALLSRVGSDRAARTAAAAAPALALGIEGAHGLTASGSDHGSVRKALGELLAPLADDGSAQSRALDEMHDRAAQIVADAGGPR